MAVITWELTTLENLDGIKLMDGYRSALGGSNRVHHIHKRYRISVVRAFTYDDMCGGEKALCHVTIGCSFD